MKKFDADVFELVQSIPDGLGECPTWSVAEQALVWVDIPGKKIHKYLPTQQQKKTWNLPSECGSFALINAQEALLALRSGLHHFNFANAHLQPQSSPVYDTGTTRFNDGRADAQGRFWVGTMFEPRTQKNAKLYCVEKDVWREVFGDFTLSNGLAFSPDNQRMYHSDTVSHTVWTYDFNVQTGAVSNQHVFAQFDPTGMNVAPSYGGRPDGAAVDSEDCYWSAMFGGARLLRFAPTGECLAQYSTPCQAPTMVAFGGADLKTLYLTSASINRSAEELARYPHSGCVMSMRVDVPGLPEPCYVPQ